MQWECTHSHFIPECIYYAIMISRNLKHDNCLFRMRVYIFCHHKSTNHYTSIRLPSHHHYLCHHHTTQQQQHTTPPSASLSLSSSVAHKINNEADYIQNVCLVEVESTIQFSHMLIKPSVGGCVWVWNRMEYIHSIHNLYMNAYLIAVIIILSFCLFRSNWNAIEVECVVYWKLEIYKFISESPATEQSVCYIHRGKCSIIIVLTVAFTYLNIFPLNSELCLLSWDLCDYYHLNLLKCSCSDFICRCYPIRIVLFTPEKA